MPVVFINGQEIEIGPEERLNGIQAARRAGVEIPHYCWHPGLSVVASCRMCLVESGRKNAETGEISMVPKLVPACQTPATDGTVFVTNSEKVEQARAMVEEDLLIRHPIDCPICDKAGECLLQDYHFQHGQKERRADLKPFTSRRRPLGDTVTLFVDRCVMCTRCVRFCREVTDTSELMVANRGAHEEIDVFPGFPLENKMSGNVVDLCPVGALGDVDFLYQQRVWFMGKHNNVCAGCSTGCSITVDQNQDRVYRLKPRENPHINQWWMCDEGRYGWKYIHDETRCVEPRYRKTAGGPLENIEWHEVGEKLTASLKAAGRPAVLISPFLAVEEAYLLAKFALSIDEEALLGVGQIPVVGKDESFPTGFTIAAEKCPNRQGVEAIVSRLGGKVIDYETFWEEVTENPPGSVWITGGYPPQYEPADALQRFETIAGKPLLIVQDAFTSPLWTQADYQLPGALFAERSGSYVNHAQRLQSFKWAIRPPAGVKEEGRLYWQLLGREGMYNARAVMEEIAAEISFFAPALESVPEAGVDLKVNQLASATQ